MTEASATPLRRLSTPLAVAVPVALLDLGTKAWAERALAGRPPTELWPGVVRLELHANPGAAFGLGSGSQAVPLLLGLALCAYLVWLSLRPHPADRIRRWGLGLMLGGTAANLYDRAFGDVEPYGLWGDGPVPGVVDFIVVRAGSGSTWPAFNLADVALVLGAGLLLLALWRGRKG